MIAKAAEQAAKREVWRGDEHGFNDIVGAMRSLESRFNALEG